MKGVLPRIWYEAVGESSATELAGNYRNELTAQGFRILYDSSKDPDFVKRSNFLAVFGDIGVESSRSVCVPGGG